MGFMDRAKDAAEDLRTSLVGGEARESEQVYRDLGMLAYLTSTGRPIDEADRQRLVDASLGHRAAGQAPGLPPGHLSPAPPTPAPPAPPTP